MRHFLDFRKAVLQGPGPETTALLKELEQQLIEGVYWRTMGFAQRQHIVRQLHQLQKDSIRLLNQIHSFEDPFYALARQSLIALLDHLKEYKYFDREQTVPIYLAEHIRHQFEDKIILLEAGMKKNKIAADVQAIVLNPFLNFGKKGFSSYEQMDYLVHHGEEFIAYVNQPNAQAAGVIGLFLNKGFNSDDFHHYYLLRIAAEVQTEYKTEGQFNVLYEYERSLSLLSKKPYRNYDSSKKKTREVLLAFVKTELHYLKRKPNCSTPKAHALNSIPSSYRLETTLSVDSFAYLVRLLIENEVIEASPRTALMDFLSAHLKTKRRGEEYVSANSLTVKYKQVTQTTAVGIRSLLVRMAKQVEADFHISKNS